MLVLKHLKGLQTVQLLQGYWLGHRLGLLCLPWKQTETILSFLRLHPSTAFWTLLLTMMATVIDETKKIHVIYMLTFSGSLAKSPQVRILIFEKRLFSSLLMMSHLSAAHKPQT